MTKHNKISNGMKHKTSKHSEKSLSFHLGNLFIVLSFLMFMLIFYPVISVYLFPPSIKDQNELRGNYITVPKIHAQAPLVYNVDPFNQSEYKKVLKKGVAHARGTALPGERGSIFVFAHSSGNPIEQTNYNTIFLKLGRLEKNDEILIKKDGKVFKYKVVQKKIVWPSEVGFLTKQTKDQLILQTCWPIGTSLKRLLIFAIPSN